jgi:hypothetical protein
VSNLHYIQRGSQVSIHSCSPLQMRDAQWRIEAHNLTCDVIVVLIFFKNLGIHMSSLCPGDITAAQHANDSGVNAGNIFPGALAHLISQSSVS